MAERLDLMSVAGILSPLPAARMGNKKQRRRAERRAASGASGPADPSTAEPARTAPGRADERWLFAKGPALRFVLTSATLMLLFYGVFYTTPEESPTVDRLIESYLSVYAWATGIVLELFGFETLVDGTLVVLDGRGVQVVRGCDAMEPIALFVAAVVAFPAAWRAKFAGLLVGVAALVLLNLVRIILLTVISARYPESFEAAHLTVGQTLYVLCTLALWFAWAFWATRREKRADALRAG